uniref:SCP domain-containing protein n=1 Tax=Trichuris muris TaxID=70415 RepID=A0A5S6QVZ1_TRIMR
MECLTGWSHELEAEAQSIADKCEPTGTHHTYGVGIACTSDDISTITGYRRVIQGYNDSVADDCSCASGMETKCHSYKQFTYWNAGAVGCAKSKCYTSNTVIQWSILTCLFSRKVNFDKCAYATGKACDFCSDGLGCVNHLCCEEKKPAESSCGSKPVALVPLYRMYHEGKKFMALTSSGYKKEYLRLAGYSDFGILGYVSSHQQACCSLLKPLEEFTSPNHQDNVYLTDRLLMESYSQKGYMYTGTVGYVVDDGGFCSSTATAYNFLISDLRNFYTSDKAEATKIASRKGNYTAYWYQGTPFALWAEQ